MKAILSVVMSLAVLGLFGAPTVWAQDKGKDAKSTRKVLAENDKMIVFEVRQKPGEQNTPTSSSTRAVRALQGGTILRTYADGKTETKEWKTGDVEIQVPGPAYTTKNIGKTEFVVYVVVLKDTSSPAPAKK